MLNLFPWFYILQFHFIFFSFFFIIILWVSVLYSKHLWEFPFITLPLLFLAGFFVCYVFLLYYFFSHKLFVKFSSHFFPICWILGTSYILWMPCFFPTVFLNPVWFFSLSYILRTENSIYTHLFLYPEGMEGEGKNSTEIGCTWLYSHLQTFVKYAKIYCTSKVYTYLIPKGHF